MRVRSCEVVDGRGYPRERVWSADRSCLINACQMFIFRICLPRVAVIV